MRESTKKKVADRTKDLMKFAEWKTRAHHCIACHDELVEALSQLAFGIECGESNDNIMQLVGQAHEVVAKARKVV